MINLSKATEIMANRGPDDQGLFNDEFVGLGHRRLSVIDTSHAGHQPMSDPLGRYHIIYNGEIYNYRELRSELEGKGATFHSATDTEVILYLYMLEGEQCLKRINGFFTFAIYDQVESRIFIARDRYGIKPLYYYQDQDKFLFASEMKSILTYGIDKSINKKALLLYFQLNYIPGPYTMLNGVKKLLPGHCIIGEGNQIKIKKYYEPLKPEINIGEVDGNEYGVRFKGLLQQSVRSRLVSDVPLGCFLSGGLDSSVITYLASKETDNLKTYSIGFRDDKYFDETRYAEKVARHCKTSHTTFTLTRRDLYDQVFNVLDSLDEPFADSSALAVYILSKETRKHVTVALSGDGADELLGGYNKHQAFCRMLDPGAAATFVKSMAPLWKVLPKSRSTFITDKVRQMHRFSDASSRSGFDQYWNLAGFLEYNSAKELLNPDYQYGEEDFMDEFKKEFNSNESPDLMNQWLEMDQHLVLPNDMLFKVDKMSMVNSLEVRVPFLDHQLVEFINGLPSAYKIKKGKGKGKLLLREAFRKDLPSSIIKRGKHGFEVPLLSWFRKEMKSLILEDLLSEEFIIEQGIFNPRSIKKLIRKLFSINPGDVHATVWALIVFQWWYRKWFRV